MKHWMFVFALIFSGAMIFGCSSSNPCQQVAAEQEKGVDEECSMQEGCQFCECYRMGQVVNSAGDGCEDPEGGGEGGSCSGEIKQAAQACLSSDECKEMQRESGRNLVQTSCGT